MLQGLTLSASLALISTSAFALDGYIPCAAGNEDLPRITETPYGVPLTETFTIKYAGRSYAVPIGFLSPWPPERFYRSQPFDAPKGFEFSFWMPDGRMPEIDTYWTVRNRPCEAGRVRPREESYIVDIKFLPLPQGERGRLARFDDERILGNLNARFNVDRRVQITRRGAMIEYRPERDTSFTFFSVFPMLRSMQWSIVTKYRGSQITPALAMSASTRTTTISVCLSRAMLFSVLRKRSGRLNAWSRGG